MQKCRPAVQVPNNIQCIIIIIFFKTSPDDEQRVIRCLDATVQFVDLPLSGKKQNIICTCGFAQTCQSFIKCCKYFEQFLIMLRKDRIL